MPVGDRAADFRGRRLAALVAATLGLTPSGSRMAALPAKGLRVQEIAAAADWSEHDVGWLVTQVSRKLGMSRQVAPVAAGAGGGRHAAALTGSRQPALPFPTPGAAHGIRDPSAPGAREPHDERRPHRIFPRPAALRLTPAETPGIERGFPASEGLHGYWPVHHGPKGAGARFPGAAPGRNASLRGAFGMFVRQETIGFVHSVAARQDKRTCRAFTGRRSAGQGNSRGAVSLNPCPEVAGD